MELCYCKLTGGMNMSHGLSLQNAADDEVCADSNVYT